MTAKPRIKLARRGIAIRLRAPRWRLRNSLFSRSPSIFDAARDLFFIHARKSEAQRIGLRILKIEMAARNIDHAALADVNQSSPASKPGGSVTQTDMPPSGRVHTTSSGMNFSSAASIASRRLR